MTRTLLKLQFVLWGRSLRKNPSSMIMSVLVFVYALLGLFSIGAMTAFAMHEGAYAAVAGAVGVGTLAYLLASVMMPSGESQLSPESFAIYPIRAKELIGGFALAAIAQSRGVAALICTIGTTLLVFVPLIIDGKGWLIAVIIPAMILQFLITIVLGLCLTTALGGTSTRASKERMTIIGTFLAFIGYFAFMAMINSDSSGNMNLGQLGRYIMWTPLGAAGGVISGAADGNAVTALGCLLIAALTFGIALWFWLRGVANQLEAPLESVQKTNKRKEKAATTGVPLLLPGLRYGLGAMIYSRALVYSRRDSRLLGSFLLMPVFSIYFLYMGAVQQPGTEYLGAFVVALLGSALAANDFGYDGPANWLHISANVPARTLVPARHFASMTIGYLFLIAYLIAMNILANNHVLALILTPCFLGLAMSGGAVGVMLSSYNPFPVAKPGTNPWQDKSSFSAGALISSFASLLIGWIPSAPGVALVLIGHTTGMIWLTAVGMIVAIALPAILYFFAIKAATKRVTVHYPEIFERVRSFAN